MTPRWDASAALGDLGLREKTIDVFAPNRRTSRGTCMVRKSPAFYDCLTRVPLILSGPHAAAGRGTSGPVSHIGHHAHAGELQGIPVPPMLG